MPEEENSIEITIEHSPGQSSRQARIDTAFYPSLGINTEAAQPEGATVGDALIFADLFRTARPFQELSSGITVDEYGWPNSITDSGVARTYMMQKIPTGSIPYGDYIMLYEGSGQVGFSSNVTVQPLPATLINQGYQGRTVTISPSTQQINVSVSGISEGEGNYIKNIRLIMPGGICGGINHVRVNNASACSDGQPYQSFVDKLKDNRNEIVFNPDYLNFMKDFNTIRLMNLLAASPGRSHCLDGDNSGSLIPSCIEHPITWEDRPQLSDAAWGGSAKTSLSTESYVTNPIPRQGVPVEVAVELVNQLDINPWINIHHAADDNYVQKLAEYVYQNLSDNLQIYLEYSNETWNSGFISFQYTQTKGIENGFNTVPSEFQGSSSRDGNYFARLRYYSKRSVEIFDLWETAFSGAERLVRTLSGFQGDTVLSKQILAFENAAENLKVDALAIAPYFSGCIVAAYDCASAPMLLPDVQTVDDVFEVIDWEPSPNGLQGILRKVKEQAAIANDNNVNLLAYEGGQNLVVTGSFPTLSDPFEDAVEKDRLRELFFAASRDPRMKQRYLDFLNGWHALVDQGTTLFTLYTQAQTYYRYGSWGIKEYLQQPRAAAPKYDAAMTFQETVEKPWWEFETSIQSVQAAITAISDYMSAIETGNNVIRNKSPGSSNQQRQVKSASAKDKIPTPDELYEQRSQQNMRNANKNELPPTLPEKAIVPDVLKELEMRGDGLYPASKDKHYLPTEPLEGNPEHRIYTEATETAASMATSVVSPELEQLEKAYDHHISSNAPTSSEMFEDMLFENPGSFESNDVKDLPSASTETSAKDADFE